MFAFNVAIRDTSSNQQPLHLISAMVSKPELRNPIRFKEALGHAVKDYCTKYPQKGSEGEILKTCSWANLIDSKIYYEPHFRIELEKHGIYDLEHEAPIVTFEDWEVNEEILPKGPES